MSSINVQANVVNALQGIAYLQAPGEGEATCAALCTSGVADMVFTNDIIDTLLFGATAVCTFIQVDNSRAMLNYSKPHESRLRIIRGEHVRRALGLQARIYDCCRAAVLRSPVASHLVCWGMTSAAVSRSLGCKAF